MTNENRCKRGMSASPTCPICVQKSESMLHALRDCIRASEVWFRMVPTSLMTPFFLYQDLRTWLKWNLGQRLLVNGIVWKNWFALICRQIWLARNTQLFEGKQEYPHVIIGKVKACAKWAPLLKTPNNSSVIDLEGWKAPEEGFVKINVDGACQQVCGLSACAGIIRNHEGQFLSGFMVNLGSGTSFEAETWGAIWGFKIARDMGFRNIVLESDCLELVEFLNSCDADLDQVDLVKEARSFVQMDWNVAVKWCNREENSIADTLAKKALGIAAGLVCFREPPQCVADALRNEAASLTS